MTTEKSLPLTDAELISEIRKAYQMADEERLRETHENQAEAEKWKCEGDMYGWNFYMGMASGRTSSDICFHRILRLLDKHRPE